MTNEYWADAATANCVWVLQTRWIVGEHEGGDVPDEACWQTNKIYLTRLEAFEEGARRSYHYGKYGTDWRIYGVPCVGIMAEKLKEAGVNQAWVDESVANYREELKLWRKENPGKFDNE